MSKMLCLLMMAPFLVGWMPPLSWSIDLKKYESSRLRSTFERSRMLYYLGPRASPKKLKKRKKPKVNQICLATGAFRLSSDRNRLFMETWCVRTEGKATSAFKREDTVVIKSAPFVFDVPFAHSAVSVRTKDDRLVVRLHFRKKGEGKDVDPHVRILHKRIGAAYEYSFNDLVPDTIYPEKV